MRELAACAPGSQLCAVVKADGYGHGAVPVARAALGAGAQWLAVALVEEGAQLRDAGITERILLLSEPSLDSFEEAYELDLTPTIYHRDAVQAAAHAAQVRGGRSTRWVVHLKVDTGMHRVGMTPGELCDVAAEVYATESLLLGGVFTHLAVADTPERTETAEQLEIFDESLAMLRAAGIEPGISHVANSAGTIAHPHARRDLVRCGISVYGTPPSPALDGMVDLHPVMSVLAEVTHTLTVSAGEGLGYGLAHRFLDDTAVAVLPVGYADGVPRDFGLNGGEVLIGGVRRPVRGIVTMDQMMVEVGPVADRTVVPVKRGDEAVLIGEQPRLGSNPGDPVRTVRPGSSTNGITASEWAALMHTIPYEIFCGLAARIPREYR